MHNKATTKFIQIITTLKYHLNIKEPDGIIKDWNYVAYCGNIVYLGDNKLKLLS